jgi:hypothetical protein
MKIIERMFAPNMTINAVLRSCNPLVEKGEQLDELNKLFNELNNFSVVRLGINYKIPVKEEYEIN